jgi:POT family proton-dependent oligopeptide transporter
MRLFALSDQPTGLYSLFYAEFWERFCYFGLRTILVLFLISHVERGGLGWDESSAGFLYGWFVSLIFLGPVLGGVLADRVFGQQRLVLIATSTLMLGHCTVALSSILPDLYSARSAIPLREIVSSATSDTGGWLFSNLSMSSIQQDLAEDGIGIELDSSAIEQIALVSKTTLALFLLGLSLIVIGTGLFKASIPVLIGRMFNDRDPRRDSAFTIFYMIINIGTLCGATIAGYLGETIAWKYGFVCVAIGMTLGTLTFNFVQLRFIQSNEENRAIETAYKKIRGSNINLSRSDWRRIGALAIICIFNLVFWAGFEQSGALLTIFAKYHTHREFLQFEIPATWFFSVNPFLIILFGPLMAKLWVALGQRGIYISDATKFSFGLFLLSAAFAFMVLAALDADSDPGQKASMLWLVVFYTLLSLAELFVAPISLSLFTKFAPKQIISMIMGLWLLAIAPSGWIAGFVLALTQELSHRWIFTMLALTSGLAALLLLSLVPFFENLVRRQDRGPSRSTHPSVETS